MPESFEMTANRALFDIERVVALENLQSANSEEAHHRLCATSKINAVTAHACNQKQLLAVAVDFDYSNHPHDKPSTSPILVRSTEEDQETRFWRFELEDRSVFTSTSSQRVKSPLRRSSAPHSSVKSLATSSYSDVHTGKDTHLTEALIALEFSPEGDWLACLSSNENTLYLVPVHSLIHEKRLRRLERTLWQPTDSMKSDSRRQYTLPEGNSATLKRHSLQESFEERYKKDTVDHEIMRVRPSIMTVQMASYLRADNEINGKNGARYRSSVKSDSLRMSTFMFPTTFGTPTCCRWWRTMLNKNFCIVGGTHQFISFVNVEENKEECRCELGIRNKNMITRIESIQLFYEEVEMLKRTTMLVKMHVRAAKGAVANAQSRDSLGYDNESTQYFRILIEKQIAQGMSSSTIKMYYLHHHEDKSFRPEKIQDFTLETVPHQQPSESTQSAPFCIFVNSGDQRKNSWLAAYSIIERKVRLYLNSMEEAVMEYVIPECFQEQDFTSCQVDLLFCSTDLILLQRTLKQDDRVSHEAVWLSLPSRHAEVENLDTLQARVVHRLTLHGNERIRMVQQTNSRKKADCDYTIPSSIGSGNEAVYQVTYIIVTEHNIYECRPQWSRLALFNALRGQSIELPMALSIGYALGVDMASMCEIVADTLCTNSTVATTAFDKLDDFSSSTCTCDHDWIMGLYMASHAQPSKAMLNLRNIKGYTQAISYGQLVMSNSISTNQSILRIKKLDSEERSDIARLLVDMILAQLSQSQIQNFISSEAHQQNEYQRDWIKKFLLENRDYRFPEILDICITHQQVDVALSVGLHRDDLDTVFQKVIDAGLVHFITDQSIRGLLEVRPAIAGILSAPRHRVLFRSLPIDLQVGIVTDDFSRLMQHRDWIFRNAGACKIEQCLKIAAKLDPNCNIDMPVAMHEEDAMFSGVGASECIQSSQAERVELFVSILLRIHAEKPLAPDHKYSANALHEHLQNWKDVYRPSLLLSRCVDFCNWEAAATIFETFGLNVDAIECRLECHSIIASQASDSNPLKPNTGHKHALYWKNLLLVLLQNQTLSRGTNTGPDESARKLIIALIFVKWNSVGLSILDLETIVLEEMYFARLKGLLASLFFNREMYMSNYTASVMEDLKNSTHCAKQKKWISLCRDLPFSGRFFYKVFIHFMEQCKSHVNASTQPQTLDEMLATVRKDINSNNRMISAIRLEQHSAQTIGKSDPLETHVRIFSCGHLYPRRVFEEVIVPEFERRMNALPQSLPRTKQLLVEEWKHVRKNTPRQASDDETFKPNMLMEAPCPICSYDRIQSTIRGENPAVHRPDCPDTNASSPYHYLHMQDRNCDILKVANASSSEKKHVWVWDSNSRQAQVP